jgi:hypothetical protein
MSSLLINYRSLPEKNRMKESMMNTLQLKIDLERASLEAQKKALIARQSGGTISASEVKRFSTPIKPKEFVTEDDIRRELVEKLKPFMVNNNQILNLISALEARGLLIEFDNNFEQFASQFLGGMSRASASQVLGFYFTFKGRLLNTEQKVSLTPDALRALTQSLVSSLPKQPTAQEIASLVDKAIEGIPNAEQLSKAIASAIPQGPSAKDIADAIKLNSIQQPLTAPELAPAPAPELAPALPLSPPPSPLGIRQAPSQVPIQAILRPSQVPAPSQVVFQPAVIQPTPQIGVIRPIAIRPAPSIGESMMESKEIEPRIITTQEFNRAVNNIFNIFKKYERIGLTKLRDITDADYKQIENDINIILDDPIRNPRGPNDPLPSTSMSKNEKLTEITDLMLKFGVFQERTRTEEEKGYAPSRNQPQPQPQPQSIEEKKVEPIPEPQLNFRPLTRDSLAQSLLKNDLLDTARRLNVRASKKMNKPKIAQAIIDSGRQRIDINGVPYVREGQESLIQTTLPEYMFPAGNTPPGTPEALGEQPIGRGVMLPSVKVFSAKGNIRGSGKIFSGNNFFRRYK